MSGVSFTNQEYKTIARSIVRKQAEQSALNQPEKLEKPPEPRPHEPHLELQDGLSVAEIQSLDLGEATKQKLVSLAREGGNQNEIIEAFEAGGLFDALKKLQPLQGNVTNPMGYTPEAYHTPVPIQAADRPNPVPSGPQAVAQTGQIPVAAMPTAQKITEALMRTPGMLPEELSERVKAFFTPANLNLLLIIGTAHSASHLVGAGQVADIVLGSIGLGLAGMEAITATEKLATGVSMAVNANSEQELDQAAEKMAEAILGGAIAVGMYQGSQALLKKGLTPIQPGALAAQTEAAGAASKLPKTTPAKGETAATDAVVQAKAQGSGKYTYGAQMSSTSTYRFKVGIDLDFRGTGQGVDKAKAIAFQKTGVPVEYFEPTKSVRDVHGKLKVVEWTVQDGPYKGAQVSIDYPHLNNPDAPHIPHVGWQTPGKPKISGHIFLDKIYAGRIDVKE